MLIKPFLAKCGDRTSLPKEHPTGGSPDDWFDNNLLLQNKLFGITFDFFVDWNTTPNRITPSIWIKRILNQDYTYSQLIEDLEVQLINEFGQNYLERVISFAQSNHLDAQILIYRDDSDWSDELSKILVVYPSKNKGGQIVLHHSLINIKQLKDRIKVYSGGAVQIGAKGLIYGTSKLECYLSSTDSLYPGDVDSIILDDSNEPVALLEYKKHTLDSPISDQNIAKYYPNPDARKYNRLAILKEYLSNIKGHDIPIIVIYYPTNPKFITGKLELLKGSVGNLSAKASGVFKLPLNRTKEETSEIIAYLQNAILYNLKN
ncbi:hypothetical protein [Pontibacter vulgaris]|uniref:hypothetical protein n=1 Tax=Pontibacter vulgaris TaxID=2905679 RepID=UPI001FA7DBA0|nr:hypothetical protein [Pontibacter vulgaris]